MDDNFDPPWWHSPKHVFFFVFGLVAFSALAMGLFVFISQLFEGNSSVVRQAPVYINYESPQDKNPRTHSAKPYEPIPWPNRPDEPAGLADRDGKRSARGASGTPSGASSSTVRSTYTGPVGMSVEEYQIAAASGKKMFLPDPKGNCDLGSGSGRDLANCFAERVAR